MGLSSFIGFRKRWLIGIRWQWECQRFQVLVDRENINAKNKILNFNFLQHADTFHVSVFYKERASVSIVSALWKINSLEKDLIVGLLAKPFFQETTGLAMTILPYHSRDDQKDNKETKPVFGGWQGWSTMRRTRSWYTFSTSISA